LVELVKLALLDARMFANQMSFIDLLTNKQR